MRLTVFHIRSGRPNLVAVAILPRHPDYIESVRKLEPGRESPIPPTSYYHLMLNVPNAVDVGYYLSKHPETIAKLWSLETSGQGIKVMQQALLPPKNADAAASQERKPE